METHSPARQPLDTYAALTQRVQLLINSPRARYEHQAVIRRESHDSQQDWDRLIEEIRDAESVRLTPRPDGSLHLVWFVTPNT